MSSETLNEDEKFAFWIDALKLKTIVEGLITYQGDVCELFGWNWSVNSHLYRGRAWQLKECDKNALRWIDVHSFIYGHSWENCVLKSVEPLVPCSLITNDVNLQCVYQGEVSFQLVPQYHRNLRLRRSVAPVYSEQGWFGILIYTRRFFFQKRWTLVAFAPKSTPVQIEPQVLLGHPTLTEEGEPRQTIGNLLALHSK